MLYENMDLSRLMVHAQKVEEKCLKKNNREAKKARSFESGSSKSRIDIQAKSKFPKKFSNQVSFKFLQVAMIWCLTLNEKGDKYLFTKRKTNL